MPFKTGRSGNPQGRPPKSDHARAAQLRRRILASAPAIIDKLIEVATAGDVVAGRAVLACCVPTLKPVEMPATLPPIPRDAGLAAQGAAVFSAMVDGHLTPSQGTSLIQAIGLLARLVETDDMMTRLEAAEREIQAMAQRPPAALPPPVAVGLAQQEPEPAPDPPHTMVELAQGESLADVAEALAIEAAELHRQIADGLIVITPAKDTTP